jgi:hypothetical protein
VKARGRLPEPSATPFEGHFGGFDGHGEDIRLKR